MEKQKKIYCGSGKKKSDTWLQVTVNPEKFAEYVQEFNGNKFIKLNINVLPEPDKYGKNISVSIDTWKPSNEQSSNNDKYGNTNNKTNYNKYDNDSSDLPF
jgi:hypothetical protein